MNQSQTIQNYEVHCGQCGWWGQKSQLKPVSVPSPTSDEAYIEPGCPICSSDKYLEFDELPEILTELNEVISKIHKLVERLKCQRSQSQS